MAAFRLLPKEIIVNPRNAWFDEFQKNVSELIAKSPMADVERNVKALMAQTFTRMDLITREEFDVQTQLLQRALERLSALERKVEALQTGGAGAEVK